MSSSHAWYGLADVGVALDEVGASLEHELLVVVGQAEVGVARVHLCGGALLGKLVI